jgi:hypothetical protein
MSQLLQCRGQSSQSLILRSRMYLPLAMRLSYCACAAVSMEAASGDGATEVLSKREI